MKDEILVYNKIARHLAEVVVFSQKDNTWYENEHIEWNCVQAEKYNTLHLDEQILELRKIQDQFKKLYNVISELICDYKIPEIEEREDYITEHLTGLQQKIITIINNKQEEYKHKLIDMWK